MKISLVTVTYNSDKTLRDTIQSVLSQSYQNLEYIIIDGASEDKTIDIVKEYEPLFNGRMHWVSEKDSGIYDAMNKGIKLCTGDIIGILNSDDILMDSNVLADVLSGFNDEIDAIFGNLYFVKQTNLNRIVRTWKGNSYQSFRTGWHPAHPTFYVRREIYEKYGVFDTSFNISADFELMLRFIEKNHIRTNYLNRYMIKMRLGGESTGNIKNIIKGNANIIRAFKKNEISIPLFYFFKRLSPKIVSMIRFKIKGWNRR